MFLQKQMLNLLLQEKNPSAALINAAGKICTYKKLWQNPSEEEMQQLIAGAHIHTLPSFNNTGIKLKLLHALFTGRHCIANTEMVQDTGLNTLCNIADDAENFLKQVNKLQAMPFTATQTAARKTIAAFNI